jgi:NAD+ diphosphatase
MTNAPEALFRTMLSGANLNRQHDYRSDVEWMANNRGIAGHVHVVWQGQVAVVKHENTMTPATVHASEAPQPDDHVFLGELDGEFHWALDLSHDTRESVSTLLPHGAKLVALREAGAQLDPDHGNLLAFAAGMGYWHRTHQHCGSCGAAVTPTTGGHERLCRDCGVVHWPRTDPAVIMLVVDSANDRALLGRQKVWPASMFSTLAGFVEPGESLEDAVARETFEEASVRVGKVRYWCSQPWPFPRSIMIGFHAEYRSGEAVPHPVEMDDVRWFTRQELVEARTQAAEGLTGPLMIPPTVTISRALIDAWLDGFVRF